MAERYEGYTTSWAHLRSKARRPTGLESQRTWRPLVRMLRRCNSVRPSRTRLDLRSPTVFMQAGNGSRSDEPARDNGQSRPRVRLSRAAMPSWWRASVETCTCVQGVRALALALAPWNLASFPCVWPSIMRVRPEQAVRRFLGRWTRVHGSSAHDDSRFAITALRGTAWLGRCRSGPAGAAAAIWGT